METISSVQDWWRSQRILGSLLGLIDLTNENADEFSVGSQTLHSRGDHNTVDVLVPPFDAPARKLSVTSATVILVTVICTDVRVWRDLEMAVNTCGVVWTTLALLLGALWSERALQLLCAAVRRSGIISYAEVAWIAYSYRAELAVASLLHFYLLTLMVEHLMALRDIIQVIQQSLWAFAGSLQSSSTGPSSFFPNDAILLVALVFSAAPTLAVQDIYTLRNVTYFSFTLFIIMLVLLYLLLLIYNIRESDVKDSDTTILWSSDTLSTLPTPSSPLLCITLLVRALLAYTPSFVLMLPLHAPLRQPTSTRVVQVIRQGVWMTFVILWAMAVGLHSLSMRIPKIYANALDEGNQWSSLSLIQYLFKNDAALYCLASLVQLMAFFAVLLVTVVLLQPCRSNVLECIHRHHVNQGLQEDGCFCEGSALPCDRLHESCPDECLKDDNGSAQETVPSFTSQSTTPRMNNNSFIPVVSSAPAPIYGYVEDYVPPLQVSAAQSNTSASELTPLVYSTASSQSHSYQGSRNSSNQLSFSIASDPVSVPSQLSSDNAQRIVKIRRIPKVDFAGEEQEEQADSRPRACNIESNRMVRISSGIIIWAFCYVLAVFWLESNETFNRLVSFSRTFVAILISCILPVTFYTKLRQRLRR